MNDLSADPEEFWRKVKTNLQAGKVRLVFVADEIPIELRRVVKFMNGQMDPAEVLAVEIKQYVGGESKVLVPRVIGQTVEAQWKKSGGANKPSEKGEAYREFFQRLIDELRERGFTKARIGQPQNWYTFASGLQGIGYGASFAATIGRWSLSDPPISRCTSRSSPREPYATSAPPGYSTYPLLSP